MLQQLIDNFYLTEREAKVYLAALEIGRSRVSVIAKKAELNRITTYEILKRLVQLGLAQSSMQKNVQTFTVVPPETVVQKMESHLHVAQTLLPQLTLLNRANPTKPSISFFEGVEGIRTLYENSLECKEKMILNIANPDNLLRAIGDEFFEQYVKKRVRRKIHVRVLLPNAPTNREFEKVNPKEMREARYLDQKEFDFSNEIFMYDSTTVLISFSSLVGVSIEDRDISKMMCGLWQIAWKSAKN